MTLRYRIQAQGIVQRSALAFGDAFYRAGMAFGVREQSYSFSKDSVFMVHQKSLWASVHDGGLFGLIFGTAGTELVKAGMEEAATTYFAKKLGQEAAEIAASGIGLVVDLAFFAYDSAVCDDGLDVDEYVEVTLMLENGKTYDAFLVLETRVSAAAIFGDSWAYVDFYDYPAVSCGGARRGFKLTFDSAHLERIAR